MTIRFTPAAADLIVSEASARGQSVREFCVTRFKDFHHGLKLVAQGAPEREFVLDVEAVQSPDKVLSEWVVASYRGRTGEGA